MVIFPLLSKNILRHLHTDLMVVTKPDMLTVVNLVTVAGRQYTSRWHAGLAAKTSKLRTVCDDWKDIFFKERVTTCYSRNHIVKELFLLVNAYLKNLGLVFKWTEITIKLKSTLLCLTFIASFLYICILKTQSCVQLRYKLLNSLAVICRKPFIYKTKNGHSDFSAEPVLNIKT